MWLQGDSKEMDLRLLHDMPLACELGSETTNNGAFEVPASRPPPLGLAMMSVRVGVLVQGKTAPRSSGHRASLPFC